MYRWTATILLMLLGVVNLNGTKTTWFHPGDHNPKHAEHACHLSRNSPVTSMVTSNVSYSGTRCGTFDVFVCCFVDQYGWMPTYHVGGKGRVQLNEDGSHNAVAPRAVTPRALEDCPDLDVTRAPTPAPISPTTSLPTPLPTIGPPYPTDSPTTTPFVEEILADEAIGPIFTFMVAAGGTGLIVYVLLNVRIEKLF